MALSAEEYALLRRRCDSLEDGPDYRCHDYIENLINTVIDFQMQSPAVQRATNHFNKHKITTHDQLKALIDKFPNNKEGNQQLARELWNYNLWSRAKFLRTIMECFERRGIRDQESLKKWVHNADYHRDVQGRFRTEEHSIGYAIFKWLELRLGIDTVKPDVHILRFIADSIGRSVTANEAVSALTRIAKETNRDAFKLDAAIWNYQRDLKANSRRPLDTSQTLNRTNSETTELLVRSEFEPVPTTHPDNRIPVHRPPSSQQGEKSQQYYELIERCQTQRPSYSTELLECMLLGGATINQMEQAVFEFLGRRYTASSVMGFIKHRSSRGWVINEENGIWSVIDIKLTQGSEMILKINSDAEKQAKGDNTIIMEEKEGDHLDVGPAIPQIGFEKESLSLHPQKYESCFGMIIGCSESMRKVLENIEKAAASDSTIIIHGESGTGKDLLAKAIHLSSSRRNCPLVPIACAEISDILTESELFGNEKGAFNGAINSRTGLFELAQDGTVIFEEVADMGLVMQSKLLRVIHERQFRRIGSNDLINFRARIICTTNKDLQTAVRENRFREDLFHRINVIPIYLPPLRDRKADIPALIEHFLKKLADDNGKDIHGVTKEAIDQLLQYDYPGNVLELRNILERAVVMARGSIITVDDLPFGDKFTKSAGATCEGQLKGSVQELEKQMVMKALQDADNNQTKAAELLGISERMLRYKLKKYGLKN